MNNAQIIEAFYTAFKNLDADKMASFYHQDVEFTDPAFGHLKGDRASQMWKMLLSRQQGKAFIITYNNIKTEGERGSADWEAIYHFGPKQRKVHNKINAAFEFKEGKIIKHTDHFDLHKWAKQAIGFKGYLIGGTSFFKRKLNQQTVGLLNQYISSK